MSRTASLTLLSFAALLPGLALAQPDQDIGAWRLACIQDRMTDRAACTLRHRDWVEKPSAGTPGLALEVIDRRGRLVPAVTARELTIEGASHGSAPGRSEFTHAILAFLRAHPAVADR